MSEDRWIVVRNWDLRQTYDKRRKAPPWIKVYLSLLHEDAYLDLSLHARGVLLGIWLEFAASDGQLRGDTATVSRRLGGRVSTATLESLRDAGFIEFLRAEPPKLGRLETETETETDRKPFKRNSENPSDPERLSRSQRRKITGCRWVRGSHGSTHVRDPLGTDAPPKDWPYERPSDKEIDAALKGAET